MHRPCRMTPTSPTHRDRRSRVRQRGGTIDLQYSHSNVGERRVRQRRQRDRWSPSRSRSRRSGPHVRDEVRVPRFVVSVASGSARTSPRRPSGPARMARRFPWRTVRVRARRITFQPGPRSTGRHRARATTRWRRTPSAAPINIVKEAIPDSATNFEFSLEGQTRLLPRRRRRCGRLTQRRASFSVDCGRLRRSRARPADRLDADEHLYCVDPDTPIDS